MILLGLPKKIKSSPLWFRTFLWRQKKCGSKPVAEKTSPFLPPLMHLLFWWLLLLMDLYWRHKPRAAGFTYSPWKRESSIASPATIGFYKKSIIQTIDMCAFMFFVKWGFLQTNSHLGIRTTESIAGTIAFAVFEWCWFVRWWSTSAEWIQCCGYNESWWGLWQKGGLNCLIFKVWRLFDEKILLLKIICFYDGIHFQNKCVD